jgi:ATP-dependent DNA helicase RecQ
MLMTVHAAKGLEFRHVVVAGGFWRCPPEKLEEERRLYYVGMTRARETLHLIERRDEPNPHVVVLGGESVERRSPHVPRPDDAVVRRRYQLLGLGDLHLSSLRPRSVKDGVWLVDEAGGVVAALSREAARGWAQRLAGVESIRVLALVERRAEDSEEAFRSRYRCERWEVPLVEAVDRIPTVRA